MSFLGKYFLSFSYLAKSSNIFFQNKQRFYKYYFYVIRTNYYWEDILKIRLAFQLDYALKNNNNNSRRFSFRLRNCLHNTMFILQELQQRVRAMKKANVCTRMNECILRMQLYLYSLFYSLNPLEELNAMFCLKAKFNKFPQTMRISLVLPMRALGFDNNLV